MIDLARWLGQQLDTDAAEIANPYAEKAWHARGCESVPDVLYPDRETGACDCGVPARVLREINAKQRTLLRCQEALLVENLMLVHFAKQTLWDMARAYEHRPGYEEAIASLP